jgi:hypothetical protein
VLDNDDKRQDEALEEQKLSPELRAAIARGLAYKTAELESPGNVLLRQAVEMTGRTSASIMQSCIHGELYSLSQPIAKSEARYPAWQFAAAPDRLRLAIAPWTNAGASVWTMHNFFCRPNLKLNGRSPADWIVDPRVPIEIVVNLATSRFANDQGAD